MYKEDEWMNVCSFPQTMKECSCSNLHSGDTCLDGQHLLVSNLCDGVDKYAIPIFHHIQSYHHAISVNVPHQLSVTCEARLVIVGGDNGFIQISDNQTSAFCDKLDHRSGVFLFLLTHAQPDFLQKVTWWLQWPSLKECVDVPLFQAEHAERS